MPSEKKTKPKYLIKLRKEREREKDYNNWLGIVLLMRGSHMKRIVWDSVKFVILHGNQVPHTHTIYLLIYTCFETALFCFPADFFLLTIFPIDEEFFVLFWSFNHLYG